MKVKLELTEDFLHLKKGDIIERSKPIARLHTHKLKNAKVFVPKKRKSKKEE